MTVSNVVHSFEQEEECFKELSNKADEANAPGDHQESSDGNSHMNGNIVPHFMDEGTVSVHVPFPVGYMPRIVDVASVSIILYYVKIF